MNIYGHFYILSHKIHYITFVGMVVLGLFYLYRFRSLNAPVLLKILLPCVYMFGGLMHYEIMWNSGWMCHYPVVVVVVDFIAFSICEGLIVYTIWLMRDKFKYNIPQVNSRRWAVVTGIMVIMILWLNSTGFYVTYKLVDFGVSVVDPHNFAWAVGKVTCLLSWLWIPEF